MKKKAKTTKSEQFKPQLKQIEAVVKEHKYALILAFVLFAYSFHLHTALVHIPGPIFGGDLYRERGYTDHLLRGGSVFEDPTIVDAYPYFPWLGYALSAIVAKVFSMSSEMVMVYLPVFVIPFTWLTHYLIGLRIFDDKRFALLTMAFYAATTPIDIKITSNVSHLAAALTIYFLIRFIEEKKLKDAILGGVMYGLVALSHGATFISLTFLILFSVLLYAAKLHFMDKEKLLNIVKDYRYIFVFYAIAVLLSLLFFGPLIACCKLHQDNPVATYALNDINDLGVFYSTERAMAYFVPSITSPFTVSFLKQVLVLSGMIFCLLNFRKNKLYAFTLLMFFAVYLGVSHYLLTMPLFDMWFEPWKVPDQYVTPLAIFAALGLWHISRFIPKKSRAKGIKVVVLVGLLIAGAGAYKKFDGYVNNNQWFAYGTQIDPQTQIMYDVGDWIKANVGLYDVILANDESSFALNAMSGAKVAFLRRVHANYFVGIDRRYAEGMVMLYGKDQEMQKDLIRKNKVKFLYMDPHLMQYPIVVKDEFAPLLEENGVYFERQKVRFDPSTNTAPYFDALIVPPQNLTIEELIEPVNLFTIQGQPYSMIARVNVE